MVQQINEMHKIKASCLTFAEIFVNINPKAKKIITSEKLAEILWLDYVAILGAIPTITSTEYFSAVSKTIRDIYTYIMSVDKNDWWLYCRKHWLRSIGLEENEIPDITALVKPNYVKQQWLKNKARGGR